MARELTGKVVVLTGASRGIGRAIALDLARAGAKLVLAARDASGLGEVADEARKLGASVLTVETDVAVAADRERLVAKAEEMGPIEVLVNNAGVEVPVSVVDHTPEDIEREIAVNLLAPIQLTRLVLPLLLARNSGAIAMLSSMSGKSPTPYNAIYSASKYGLNGFTASLRIELRETGVHAGVCCPSFVADAGMWADTGVAAPAMLKEVSLDRVVAGIRAVIDGRAEVLVTPMPVRPMLALSQFFPRLDQSLLLRMGVLRVLEERATALAAQRAGDQVL